MTTEAPAGGLLVEVALGAVLWFDLTAAATGEVVLHLDGVTDHLELPLGPPGQHQHHLHLPLPHLDGVARVGGQVATPQAPFHGDVVRHHLDHLLHGDAKGDVGGEDQLPKVQHHGLGIALDS